MKGSIPISTIAERSGVSIATVSRILNQSTAVREVTRDRVLRVTESTARHLSAVTPYWF